MKKKTKFVAPETVKGYGASDHSGLWLTVLRVPDLVHDTPIRILRERDYQRLLKLARKP